MRTYRILLVAFLISLGSFSATAHEKHQHDHSENLGKVSCTKVLSAFTKSVQRTLRYGLNSEIGRGLRVCIQS